MFWKLNLLNLYLVVEIELKWIISKDKPASRNSSQIKSGNNAPTRMLGYFQKQGVKK